jgi:hippurate hydrolase
MILAAQQSDLSGEVIFMFQPGEEGCHGARYMIEDGLLDPLPEAAFALHVEPNLPSGTFSGRSGTYSASTDTIRIWVEGRGGHGSAPHSCIDPIPIMCEIVSAIQAFVARRVSVFDPAVVTIGKIEAGTTYNIIPDTAFALGTIRALSRATREFVCGELPGVVKGIAAAHGAVARVEIDPGYPSVVCDAQAFELARDVVIELFGPASWRTMSGPDMGGEDFAYIAEQVPSAMLLLGVAPPSEDWRSRPGIHSSRMTIDEAAMGQGAAFHAAIAAAFLEQGFVRQA